MRFSPAVPLKELRYLALLTAALLSGAGILSVQRGVTQTVPTCDPPSANEYLLLVTDQQADTEEQLRRLLPANAALTSCQYLNDQVVRVGGFASAEIANAWAKYVTDMTGLQAVVARPTADTAATATPTTTPTAPADTGAANGGATNGAASSATSFPTPTQIPATGAAASPTPTPPAQSDTAELPSLNQAPDAGVAPTPSPTAPAPAPSVTPSAPAPSPSAAAPATTSATSSFNPKPLGSGYAVLVNYANRPEVAADVRQVTSQPVGLVSYNQRPFLLAAHTTDAAAAAAVLQSLNDRGFNAILIDSRSAVLLTPVVVGTGE